jgi:hypothetical protein
MLTAAHCGNANFVTPFGTPVGVTTRIDNNTDSEMLYNQDYEPVVHNGDWQSGTAWYVNGYGDPWVGEYTCDSGAYSGEVCGAHVTNSDYFVGSVGPDI